MCDGYLPFLRGPRLRGPVLLTLAFLFALLASPWCRAVPAARPNIILMMADDQGWGDTGYNGHPHLQTPHLDRMASEGVQFTRFYSANAMCSPTRGSCYTGRHPYRYGITFAMSGMLEPGEICISTVLKEHGYTTGHFGKWHMGTLSPIPGDQARWGDFAKDPVRYYCPPWERDVDVCFVTESKVPTWDPMRHPGDTKGNQPAEDAKKGQPYGNEYFTGPGTKATENLEGDDARVIMDRVLPFIGDAHAQGRPFFCVIWFHTPHSPVVAGEGYRRRYAEFPEPTRHFYGCITAMDEQIGRLRRELDALDITDDTMLWYCSDNGPARQGSARHVGSTGGLSGAKLSLLEGGVRVPGLLVWPRRFPEPKQVDTPCVTSDYFPTILAALDIPLPADRTYDGVNLLPLIEDTSRARPKPIGFIHRKSQAWIEGRWKLYTKDGKKYQLFDLATDPAERHDLAADRPELVERLKKEFTPWYDDVMRDLESVP